VLAATIGHVDGVPVADPLLRPLVQWGTNCVDTARVTAPIMTLASSPAGGRLPSIPSLPLAAVAALRTAAATAPQETQVAGVMRAVALDSVIAGDRDAKCGFAAGDVLVRMAVDFAPRHEHQEPEHRVSYLDVLQGKPLGDLRGRLVLVGVESSRDTFPIVRGFSRESRPGLEVEADAMNTILRGIRIAPLANVVQFWVILAMAAMGALVAYHASRLRWPAQALLLAGGLALYFAFGAGLYAREHTLLNTLFDLLALGLAFLAVRFTRRMWFPRSRGTQDWQCCASRRDARPSRFRSGGWRAPW
jgi:CHASE2 domain-containing sensor protein